MFFKKKIDSYIPGERKFYQSYPLAANLTFAGLTNVATITYNSIVSIDFIFVRQFPTSGTLYLSGDSGGPNLIGTGVNAIGVSDVVITGTGTVNFCKNYLAFTSASPYQIFNFEPFRTTNIYLTASVIGIYSITISYIYR